MGVVATCSAVVEVYEGSVAVYLKDMSTNGTFVSPERASPNWLAGEWNAGNFSPNFVEDICPALHWVLESMQSERYAF